MKNPLNVPIRYLKGIGPKRAKIFNKLGVSTIEDLLYYFPRRYEDRAHFVSIQELKEGQIYTIKAEVLASGQRQSFRRRSFSIIEILVGDTTGKIPCLWFNQPYLKDYFKPGQTLILYGKVSSFNGRLQMNSAEFEIISQGASASRVSGKGIESLNIGRVTPIYTLPSGITQRYFRQITKQALDQNLSRISDFLPYDIRSRNNLLNLAKSLINIHFPETPEIERQAYQRLAFEEFFLFQLPLALRKLKNKERRGIAHKVSGHLVEAFISSLPFQLTPAQEKAIQEISIDMAGPGAMQRLLQGDVGSGKTVVAVASCLMAIQGGYQAAFMVPTEILARQHYENIKAQGPEVRIGLLTSSADKKQKAKIYKDIKAGNIDLIIGTHALLEEEVEFKNLGLAVIDEQHKFGVGQRALLPQKNTNPDVLIMTATPIPRTLAITLYGDLDISVINELPAGRLPIKTIRFTQEQRFSAYALAKEHLQKGLQAYIIYPVIEESYVLDMAGAKKMFEQLKAKQFQEFKLGLIHGKLKQSQQDEIISRFRDKRLDVLVATTILEVGIDIPNATCMLIEHAERFGLAGLHQLRGRIGRGRDESLCMLVSNPETEEAEARLEAMVKYSDGFRIAEEDLKIRGPGEFFGKRQHGLTELKIGNPLAQMRLLKKARDEAIRLLSLDPQLELRQNSLLKERLIERFPEYEKLMVVG